MPEEIKKLKEQLFIRSAAYMKYVMPNKSKLLCASLKIMQNSLMRARRNGKPLPQGYVY